MREVMFRGKRLHDGAWVYGFYVHFKYLDGREEHAICAGDARSSVYNVYNFWREVCQETVGQYTGLKDKNGKRIFEGDILSAHFDEDFPQNETRVIVVYRDGAFQMEQENGLFDYFDDYILSEYSVIGNVFDNPELLEVKK